MNVARFFAMRLASAALLALALTGLAAKAASADLRPLADSTRAEEWRLSNGMRVVTRDVPGSPGVAITLAFPYGTDHDPAGREAWGSLLAYLAFLSAGGDAPERTLAQLETSRPLGWRIDVHPRVTRLTELASAAQFPGVLHQMAGRFRSPTPTAATLTAARAAVHAQMLENYRRQLPAALHYRVRDAGTPQGPALSEKYAEAKGLDAVTLKQALEGVRTRFVPATAVLSLAGDLRVSGMDLKRVLENEFGSVPAGTAAPDAPPVPLHATVKLIERGELPYPIGAIGLLAPPLADSSHASFFMNALVAGASVSSRWGRTSHAPSAFHYSLLDDPTLVRFYPPLTSSDLDSLRIREEYQEALLAASRSTISFDAFSDLHDGVRWMLGGPLTQALLKRAHEDAGILATLSTTAATRELWGGEPFWSEYRRRFDAADRPEFGRWAEYFRSPDHQVQLMLFPVVDSPPAAKKK